MPCFVARDAASAASGRGCRLTGVGVYKAHVLVLLVVVLVVAIAIAVAVAVAVVVGGVIVVVAVVAAAGWVRRVCGVHGVRGPG